MHMAPTGKFSGRCKKIALIAPRTVVRSQHIGVFMHIEYEIVVVVRLPARL